MDKKDLNVPCLEELMQDLEDEINNKIEIKELQYEILRIEKSELNDMVKHGHKASFCYRIKVVIPSDTMERIYKLMDTNFSKYFSRSLPNNNIECYLQYDSDRLIELRNTVQLDKSLYLQTRKYKNKTLISRKDNKLFSIYVCATEDNMIFFSIKVF